MWGVYVCVWGGGGGDGTWQNFGSICIVIPKMNQIGDKVKNE